MGELIVVAVFAFSCLLVMTLTIWVLARTLRSERELHRREINEFAVLVMSRTSTEYALSRSKITESENGTKPAPVERELLEQVGI